MKDSGTVTAEINGKTYTGTFKVEDGMVTVKTAAHGSKTTQVGGSPPETLARMMLRELVGQGKG